MHRRDTVREGKGRDQKDKRQGSDNMDEGQGNEHKNAPSRHVCDCMLGAHVFPMCSDMRSLEIPPRCTCPQNVSPTPCSDTLPPYPAREADPTS